MKKDLFKNVSVESLSYEIGVLIGKVEKDTNNNDSLFENVHAICIALNVRKNLNLSKVGEGFKNETGDNILTKKQLNDIFSQYID